MASILDRVTMAQRVAQAHPTIGPVVACPLGLLEHDPATTGPSAGPAGLPGQVRGGVTLSDGLTEIGAASVLILGRMHNEERYKGHDELLESWPAVVARVPRLGVVGTDEHPALATMGEPYAPPPRGADQRM